MVSRSTPSRPSPPRVRSSSRGRTGTTKHCDSKGSVDGWPYVLELGPERGTLLVPVAITDRHAEPISFRNDFLCIYQDACIYDHQGRRTGVYPRLRTELNSFTRTWFRKPREQGFLGEEAEREVLG